MRRCSLNVIVAGAALIGCGSTGNAKPDALGAGTDDAYQDGAEDGRDGAAACSAAGSLDPSFGIAGVAVPIFGLVYGQVATAVAIKIDAASRIVIAGGFGAGPRSCLIARLLPDGSRDPSFGANGIVRHSVGQSVCWYNDIIVQPDGRLVALGAIDGHTYSRALLSRFLPDGTPDTTFGNGGDVLFETTQITSGAALTLDASQRIVVVGEAAQGPLGAETAQFLTRRYLPSGAIDSDFGTNGNAEAAFANGQDTAFDVAILPNGKIVVVGSAAAMGGGLSQFGIVRYQSNGTRDANFGSMGLLAIAFGAHADAAGLAFDSEGRAIVSGWSEDGGALLRLTTDGALDSSFGVDGKVVDSGEPGLGYGGVGVAMGDKTVVVGTSSNPPSSHLAIARYSETGMRDPSFGSNGFGMQIPMSSTRQIGWDAAIQPDGGVVVVGGYGNADSWDILVARYCP